MPKVIQRKLSYGELQELKRMQRRNPPITMKQTRKFRGGF